MQTKKCSLTFTVTLALFTFALLLTSEHTLAQNERVLFSFQGKKFSGPGDLVFGGAGNLYGMTSQGGAYGDGSVFELSLTANGKWTEKVLHSFSGTDGQTPAQSGCEMTNAVSLGAFVQATILNPATGKLYVYDPLVITQGTTPAVAPTAPGPSSSTRAACTACSGCR